MKLHKDIIATAIQSNVIYYDPDAEGGTFTLRLIRIMRNIEFTGEKLIEVCVPDEDIAKLDLMGYIQYFGLTITNRFHQYDLPLLYEQLGGTFPHNKRALALGVTNKGRVTLGAY